MTARRLSIRVRLTVLYGALVLLAGVLLLVVVLVLLDHVIETQPIAPADAYLEQPASSGLVATPEQVGAKAQAAQAAEAMRSDLRARTLRPLVAPAVAALVLLAVVGFATVWLVSGRALRPIRAITATARDVAAGRLDRRIGLEGPRDELRELAEAFDEMLDRLHRAFVGQRAFVGNASHELRTPVAISRTLLDVALADPEALPELVRIGSQLLEVNERQDQLIEGLLTLARSGHGIAAARPVDLAAVAAGVAEGCGAEAAARGIGLELALRARPVVRGDAVLLERLVENLVQNGLRHNRPDGGHVVLVVEQASSDALVRVVNTGPVVAAPDVAALFEPFRRAAERVDAGRGLGLGLSIVRAVAEAHGGRVDATANPDGGLTVEVVLPADA